MRIHVTDITSGDILKDDVFNHYGLHILSKKSHLNQPEISRLLQHQIDFVEIIERAELDINLDQIERTLESTATPKWLPQVKPIYNEVIEGVKNIFEAAKTTNIVDTVSATEAFEPLLNNLQLERDVVSMLLLLNHQDNYTYHHSVQVGMLSYYISNWLGHPQEQATKIGNAGFLHDIGKCKIEDHILNKPGKLTSEEFESIKQHTVYGYEIIMQSVQDESLALGALQHHERMNGQGYPHGKKGDEISEIAKIIAVADIYSAMISSRVYQKERDLLFVLKELYRLSFFELDPVITHTFIKHMIPNFIGKKVDLSDGRSGTIIMTHPTEFFSPLVQIDHHFVDLTLDRSIEIKHVFF